MWDYHLPNGRKIGLIRWNMVDTYSGVLEGDKENASKYIREDLPERAARIMPPGHPLALIELPTGELPDWLCVAELESPYSVHNAGPDFFSRLFVCWFMDDTSRSLDDVIETIIPQIDWERLAEDYDIMNF